MRFLERGTRPEFGWFDLVFIVIAFTLTRDLLTGLLQTLCFAVIGFIVAIEQVLLRPRIVRRRQAQP